MRSATEWTCCHTATVCRQLWSLNSRHSRMSLHWTCRRLSLTPSRDRVNATIRLADSQLSVYGGIFKWQSLAVTTLHSVCLTEWSPVVIALLLTRLCLHCHIWLHDIMLISKYGNIAVVVVLCELNITAGIVSRSKSLQCFDAVGWAAGTASGLYKTEWWGAGMVISLRRSANLHMAQLMLLPLTFSCFSKIQIGSVNGSPG